MKIISSVVAFVSFLAFIFTGSQFASCTKEVTVRDTVIQRDTVTVVKRDTVTVVDSSCAACYDLKDGLIAYYNFNGGTLNDSSGNANHITFNNAQKTTDRFGNADNAYLFNGVNSYMSVPNSATLNPQKISIMAIMKVNDFYSGTCHGNAIVTKGTPDGVAGFYTLRIHDVNPNRCYDPVDKTKEIFLGALETSGATADTSFVPSNQWINVVYTFDGNTTNIYVNGQLKATVDKAATNNGNSSPLFIGKFDHPLYPYWFNGVIDEIRIYNRELCEAEVKLLNKLKN